MFLRQLIIEDFRCYRSVTFENLGRLAIFIGENDAGKTVVLDAVDILVGRLVPTIDDFHCAAGNAPATQIVIRGAFALDGEDNLPDEFRSGGELILTRSFTTDPGGKIVGSTAVQQLGYDDDRFNAFDGLTADEQKRLIEEYGKAPGSSKERRRPQVDELEAEGRLRKVPCLVAIGTAKANDLRKYLPQIDRISSTEYQRPEQTIQRVLRSVVAHAIRDIDPATGESAEKQAVIDLRVAIKSAMDEKIAEITPFIKNMHDGVEAVMVNPDIDFTQAVSIPGMSLKVGNVEGAFSSFGEGTKKKIWIGLQDWDRRTVDEVGSRNAIRLYDEPDVNMDYVSQRKLFKNIAAFADDDQSRIQCLVSTHSMHFIDAAHPSAINLIQRESDDSRSLVRIQGDHQGFFAEIGRQVGLTNMAVLFERAFLLVEGPSEEESVPIIYQMLYGSTMDDDGIRVINLETCGAWRTVLSVLLDSRKDVVHLLLDTDCTLPTSTAKVTPDELRRLRCPPQFFSDQVTFIGAKEFEDSFSNDIWLGAVTAGYVLADDAWGVTEIQALRTTDKFSDSWAKFVREKVERYEKSRVTKPELAVAVAKHCGTEADVPPQLLDALQKLRIRAGCV